MQTELVDDRPLLTQADFLKALSFCMLLPGPEAMQLATYAGWKLRGLRGGIIAGGLFVLPGALVVKALAFAYASFGTLPLVQAAFLGIKAAVLVIVIQAILRLLGRAVARPQGRLIALFAFLALFLFDAPFPLVILCAALWGAATCSDHTRVVTSLPWRRSIQPLLIGAALWALPLITIWALGATFLLSLGLFFAKLALVSFGGAYAVLAYMTQTVVIDYGWVTTPAMIDAYGLAETTPGPLILVTQFVGILAGIAQGGWGLGVLAGLVTLWVTFVPCFIWIFAGAPLIDWLDGYPRIRASLAAITAAVVGVIASLALWFATQVLFREVTQYDGLFNVILPVWTSFDVTAAALTAVAAGLLIWRKQNMLMVLAIMALAGVLVGMLAP